MAGRKEAVHTMDTKEWRSAVEFFHRNERQALDVPTEVVHGVLGGENDGAAGCKGQSDQVLGSDDQAGLLIGRDTDDATLALQRGRDEEIAVDVAGKALRASEAAVEDR